MPGVRGKAGLAGLLLPILLPAGAANAQDPAGSGPSSNASPWEPWGISVGADLLLHHQADDLASPLRYSGFSLGAAVRVGFSDAWGVRHLDASYAAPELTSSVTRKSSHRQEGHRVSVRLLVFQRIAASKGGALSLFLGGALTGDFSFYDHWYTREEKESWTHFFGLLQPGGGWRLGFPGGGELWQEVTVPLVGLVLRPPYQGLTEVPEPTWAGPGAVTGVRQTLNFVQPLGERWEGGITYSFQGYRHRDPRSLAWSQEGLTLYFKLWDGP